MKNKLTALFLSTVVILNSCTTTLVSQTKQNSMDEVLKPGKGYTFIKNDGTKEKVYITQITEQSITGKTPYGNEVELQRNEISTVKKGNTLATVGLVAGVVAAAVVIPAYSKNEPVGGR